MAKEGSVAPKERVNIVYKPETGDAKEEVELPLKLLVMGDFTQKEDERMVEDRDPVNIDKDNFNDVLKAQDLELNIGVDNRLTDEADAQMAVKLKFNSLKDFDPDQIINQVPELQQLMELREALKALKSPLSNVPEFRKKVQSLVKDTGARERLLKELGIE
ncbi:type VI secretion system contractile sheath small subunit [Maridesulfovibrio zosterae]|uniref:type VI secretion system contractile sheath small subunit n=1 Tax=Maridesulfovibrio zosterae TaxID=82171 RepID=UPI00040FD6F5|nr:type VI secretion system contractile sheath small subunit [Maridesulfovibrio zosterae]